MLLYIHMQTYTYISVSELFLKHDEQSALFVKFIIEV